MDIKGYIFDYGGTLDTDGCHWGKMLWHSYERQKVPVTEEQFRLAYVHAERELGKNPIIQPDYTFRKTLEVKLRIEFDYLQRHGYLYEPYFLSVHHQVALLDDLYGQVVETTRRSRQVLEKLKRQHPLVLVSNFYGNISVVLEEFGLNGIFSQIVESAVVGVRKPDPRIFLLGAEALGVEPQQTVVVGDSLHKDIIPAARAGCHTVWLKGEGWGDTEEDASAAERVITALQELETIFKI